jgi:hypothetical protein
MKKKYNSQTGCYKIDIFINGRYVTSTDQSKTCKEAKEKYSKRFALAQDEKLTAFFDRV